MAFASTYSLRFWAAWTLCFGIFPLFCYAQEPKTKQLDEVKITAFTPERFMVGLKVQPIDSATLARFRFQTLADFLQFQSPVAFKNYGAGQLSTISFRGTAASHTSLLWNGLNVNNPMLGQTDFSTVPLLGFDNVAIQYGSAASCVGSDAVGGSILLSSAPQWKQKGFQLTAGGQYGSFENGQAQMGFRWAGETKKGGQISTKTLLYGSQFNNYFPDTERRDRRGRTYPVEPSETAQRGLVQDVYFRKPNGNQFSVNVWLTDNKLSLQPALIDLREITQNQSYRFLMGYQHRNTLLKTGFVRDVIDYGKGDFLNPDHSRSDRYILRLEHEFVWKKADSFRQTNLRVGGEWTQYVAQVDGYGNLPLREQRGDLFALLRQQFGPKLVASVNLRQALSANYRVPFTPSLGLEYKIRNLEKSQFLFTGNIARSYRLPTLNERYWRRLGNPNILPESGLNKEIGATWKQTISAQINSQFGINLYHNLIDNWTYWNPEKAYFVENLQQVLSKGMEVNAFIKYLKDKYLISFSTIYAYTSSSQQKVYDAYASDIVGKQLVYVPVHTFNANLLASWRNWTWNTQALYNSERSVTFDHSGRPFPPYWLLNTSFSGQFNFGKIQNNFVFQVNNLTNEVYPNVKKNAMPGRSFQLSFISNFHL